MVNLPLTEKTKPHIFPVFPMEPKLFPRAAALERNIVEHLIHALFWAVRVVNNFLEKQSIQFAPCSFLAIFTASFAGTCCDRSFHVAHCVEIF